MGFAILLITLRRKEPRVPKVTFRFPRASLYLLTLMGSLLLISLVVNFTFRPNINGRIFFYPVNSGDGFNAEKRGIPSRKELDQKIGIFIQELFLGPISLDLSLAISPNTKLRHATVIGKVAYIDLDSKALGGDLSISLEEAFENIRHNLLFNFPRLTDVVFTIEGHQVDTKDFL